MATHPSRSQAPKPERSVIDWLLDSDPSIRWQVMQDLTDAPAEEVAAERARVATQGWGARLLARQEADGNWGGDPDNPEWTCLLSLLWLRDMGLDPSSTEARRAVGLIRDNVTWHWWDNKPFFEGEVEPCINGRVVSVGSYFGQDVRRLVDRLLGEQMEDGGWNCEQENGSIRGSFHTTINVLEGLAEHERATGGSSALMAARARGENYLLERRLLRRHSTGEIIDPTFTGLSFPTGYYYDVLRALEYLRRADVAPDERMTEAIDLVLRKRGPDGRWRLEIAHPEQLDLGMDEAEGEGEPLEHPARLTSAALAFCPKLMQNTRLSNHTKNQVRYAEKETNNGQRIHKSCSEGSPGQIARDSRDPEKGRAGRTRDAQVGFARI